VRIFSNNTQNTCLQRAALAILYACRFSPFRKRKKFLLPSKKQPGKQLLSGLKIKP